MSDSDYILEHFGISWLAGTAEHGLKKALPTPTERYKHRKLTSIKIENKDLQQLAEQLVDIKNQLKLLQAKERHIKSQIFNEVRVGEYLKVENDDAVVIIEKNRTTKAATLPRKRTYSYVKERYGQIAARELLEHCLSQYKSKETIYVRQFPLEKVPPSQIDTFEESTINDLKQKPTLIDLDDEEFPFA
jgi:hypothetical protein